LAAPETCGDFDVKPSEPQLSEVTKVLALDEGGKTAIRRIAEELIPVLRREYQFDFFRAVAERVQPPYECSEARAGDVIDRDPFTLECFQHADVGRTPRAAAAQSEADLWGAALVLSGAEGIAAEEK